MDKNIKEIASKAKKASLGLATAGSMEKNSLLKTVSNLLQSSKTFLMEENKKDIKEAQKNNHSSALIDRLILNEKVIDAMSEGLEDIATLPDPVGEVIKMRKMPNGISVGKVRIPLGVIGMIYESRPNVTIDAAALCLKAGNAVILRGGSEAINSNLALASIMHKALRSSKIPVEAVQVVPTTDRGVVTQLLKLKDYIDVIIPRGGESLIKMVYENSTIPVIAHYKGVCHVYIDESAPYEMAERIAINSKVQRPGVCNAMETLLVNKAFAEKHMMALIKKFQAEGVLIKGCPQTCKLVDNITPATEKDWQEEYLDLILSVKLVASINEAIEHIHCYGSKHTEAIVTTSYTRARKFLASVDSSAVMVNASTRFNDGGQLGLGAEIGISTSKLHAFGPMGLEELTTSKFIVYGDGQIRE